MRSIERVAKNSLWSGIQPLLLNVVSLFVIGYIANRMGKENYGRFVFAFALIAVFTPIAQMGLRPITVREIASQRNHYSQLLANMLTLRVLLAFLTFWVVVLAVNIMNYPPATLVLVYFAGITLFFNSIATTLFDVFQALEQMEYVAYSNFISGLILTALSVIVVYLGYGIASLTATYVFGSFVLMIAAVYYFARTYHLPKFLFNLVLFREMLRKAFPFFIIGTVSVVNAKIGLIILSKLSGESAVGLFGAASNLTDRLNIIPDSVATAIFPAIASLYESSREEVTQLFERFSNYLLLMGLPIAFGTSILSHEIITFIYKEKYLGASPTLSILAWTTPFLFVRLLQAYTLGAMKLQNWEFKLSLAAMIINVVLSALLIPFFNEEGVAMANLASAVIIYFCALYLMHKVLRFRIKYLFLFKAVAANILMCIPVLLLKKVNFIAAIMGGVIFYLVALSALEVVTRSDWMILRSLLKKKPLGDVEL
jgi:O-antigen/teichoic acid export membrane protein